jgi:cytochrome oxidase Cu insertion factor (SCO1/SenC/PrrC family)
MDHTSLIFLTDAEHRVVESFRSGTPSETLASAIEARFSGNG